MPKSTARTVVQAVGIAAAILTLAITAQAQVAPGAPKKVSGATSTSTRTRGGGGDANVRREDAPNPIDKPATPEPPGKSTRGLTPVEPGFVCIDSRVDLLVKIYVNGAFAGTVSPWGDSCGHYGAGEQKLYARAVFTEGSVSSWGPLAADATPGFRWTIRP